MSLDTDSKFRIYAALLRKWQPAINLVGPSTLAELERVHFDDSCNIIKHIDDLNITMADLGSGAGFPGMVLAILGVKNVHLIESDTRKTVFLQEVSRETQTPVTIHNRRIEACQIPALDLITARALAPLEALLSHMHHLDPEGRARGLFLKGEKLPEELENAQRKWHFDFEIFEKKTKVISIRNLKCFT